MTTAQTGRGFVSSANLYPSIGFSVGAVRAAASTCHISVWKLAQVVGHPYPSNATTLWQGRSSVSAFYMARIVVVMHLRTLAEPWSIEDCARIPWDEFDPGQGTEQLPRSKAPVPRAASPSVRPLIHEAD